MSTKKRTALAAVFVIFGFVTGRSSVTRSRAPEPALTVGSEIVVSRPAREAVSKDGTVQAVYESQRLRVFGWRGSETHMTRPATELPAWRVAVAGKEYVAAPVD